MAYLFTEILIIGTQKYKRGFVKKTREIKLKIQEEQFRRSNNDIN